jgi:hypothetical protein
VAIFLWPLSLTPYSFGADIMGRIATSSRSVTGRRQTILRGSGHWQTRYTEFPIATKEQRRHYRYILERFRLGDQAVAPFYDLASAPNLDSLAGEMSANATYFAGASVMQVAYRRFQPVVGMIFGYGNRVYMVTDVSPAASLNGMGNPLMEAGTLTNETPWSNTSVLQLTNLTITPTLRETIPVSSVLKLRDLTLLSELDDFESGGVDYEAGRFGRPSLTLMESLP